jgi:CRP/FNR family cyclic AMP-dependent transcriptional regulator
MAPKKVIPRKTRSTLAGVAVRVRSFERKETIYSQGEPGNTVFYIREGGVKLSATTQTGKEVVIDILGPRNFIGEKCISGWSVRRTTAIAIAPSVLYIIQKNEMSRLLRSRHPFANVFISYVLARNLQTEEDLIDSLSNKSEKRLARVLLRLADQENHDNSKVFAELSQGTLARMIGTTRSRVNFFMNEFRKRGLISYTHDAGITQNRNNGLQINRPRMAASLRK